ncbi:MAG: pyruvate:ferredoxin (flavodoxin) oxidoreductase, partial [Fidelibacterota bacterium]
SVQETMDLALIAQAATLDSRITFLHFFDGFRTSHEVAKVEMVSEETMRTMIDETRVAEHRRRALSPDHPVLRGSAQNPDVFFQARERVNPAYAACPGITQDVMDRFAGLTGRQYRLFDYHGHPEAERVIVLMGSGCEAAHETVDYLVGKGEKVGVIKVRLFRPFDGRRFREALPETTRSVAVLDRTKEPGSAGEPLFLDCAAALQEWSRIPVPAIIGGRYGLASKEFTPAMVKGVFDHLAGRELKRRFTIGIHDDVSRTSLPYDPEFSTEPEGVFRGLFYGLGSDGTVSANKNSIKIIGENTPNYAQGYFVYDSRKAGAVTVSHLRFGPAPIRSSYLLRKANFIGCHNWVFLERFNVLEHAVPGGIFLLNSPYGPNDVWDRLPRPLQRELIEKEMTLYVIDASRVARECGLGGIISTIMQTCFFAVSGILPRDDAIGAIKNSIRKTFRRKGQHIVKMNLKAVDETLAHLFPVTIPGRVTGSLEIPPPVPPEAPEFVREVVGEIIAGRGDQLPVSKLPPDGTFPTGTARWEKRNLAQEIPVWEPDLCIQCGKCAIVCPHGVIRIKAYPEKYLKEAPPAFKAMDARDRQWKGLKYTIQVAPEDCTGCGVCVDVCPARSKTETDLKAINMRSQPPLRIPERENWKFFLGLPEMDRRKIKVTSVRQQQVQQPLFEFSGACAGCGETPYIKLATQLFGDRMIVANATGCSSIYGGNLPTTPWTRNKEGRGPAWSNSLFEDNAEFGLGFRLSIDKQKEMAEGLVKKLSARIGDELSQAILTAGQRDEAEIFEQRERVQRLKEKLRNLDDPDAARLMQTADMLVKKSVWIIGGDGWAYDIGFGGLDHVLASRRDVNILVLDTEVYSNTGGQMSKATPRAAVTKFAAGGKTTAKKDLGRIAMTYGHVYVASVAMGARDEQTLRAFLEAESYPGPSLIIAYSQCIAHGIDMTTGMQNQKAAVDSGQWLLYRYNPERIRQGENPLIVDSRRPKIPVTDYMAMENRFKMLTGRDPEAAKKLARYAQEDVDTRWRSYEFLASRDFHTGTGEDGSQETVQAAVEE